MIRLDKYLADTGLGTRSEVKILLKKGRISVNGTIEKDGSRKISEDTDIVCFDEEPVAYSKYHYFLFHKPAGCITAAENGGKTATVMDYFKDTGLKNLFPVGRLDKDTEGLLLITDDGPLSHELLSPKKHVPKTYFARLAKAISDEDIILLTEGVDIGDEKPTLPAKCERISDDAILLTITEGRYHQIKRMAEAVMNEVIYLKRISMGELTLPEDLPMGEYRELTKEQVLKGWN